MTKKKGNVKRPIHLHLSFLLVLAVIPARLPAQEKPYRGAEYRTRASYTYGRFEVRMKSATGSGMLTSFFTFHDPFPFTAANWNEIDIEILGRYKNEVQFNSITPNRIDHVQRHVVPFDPANAFHIYGFEWTPDYVAWQVDGYEVYRQTGAHIATLSRAQKIMMNIWQPAWVDWAGTFDPALLPIYGYYDWIRYSAYTPGMADNFTLQWTENLEDWNQTSWEKATHTFENNNVNFIPENAVFKDGYLILCLTTPEATGYRGGAVVDEDTEPPYLVWAITFGDRVHAFLSESLDPVEAAKPENYIIPGVAVHQARLLPNQRSVELQTDSLTLDQSHVLVVRNLRDRATPAQAMGVQQTPIANAVPLPAGINVGGPAAAGYLADAVWDFYQPYGRTGGEAAAVPSGVPISGSGTNPVYATYARGLTFYQLRLAPGTYDLSLLFADPESDAAGERVFDIFIEQQLAIEKLDIIALAGKNTALVKKVEGIAVEDGVLELYLRPDAGVPILSGLAVEPRRVTPVEQKHGQLPGQFDLRVYPNPLRPGTRVQFALEAPGSVEVALYDITGRRVEFIRAGEQPAGAHVVRLNAAGLSAGVYFLQLLVNGMGRRVHKVTYIK